MSYDRFVGLEPLVRVEPPVETADETMQRLGAKRWWICEYDGASTPFRCKNAGHADCRYRWVL